jgi:hypothetical protein
VNKRLLLFIPVLIFSSVFCTLSGGNLSTPTPDLEAMVDATLTVLAGQATVVPVVITETSIVVPARDFSH